jgi:hypothetical protein
METRIWQQHLCDGSSQTSLSPARTLSNAAIPHQGDEIGYLHGAQRGPTTRFSAGTGVSCGQEPMLPDAKESNPCLLLAKKGFTKTE